MRERRFNPRNNLLDYSIEKYGTELVGDIRRLGRILVLYLPLPLFWTLYDQKGSRWTIQVGVFSVNNMLTSIRNRNDFS